MTGAPAPASVSLIRSTPPGSRAENTRARTDSCFTAQVLCRLSESAELIHLGSIVVGQIAATSALVPAVSFWEHYFIRRCVQ